MLSELAEHTPVQSSIQRIDNPKVSRESIIACGRMIKILEKSGALRKGYNYFLAEFTQY